MSAGRGLQERGGATQPARYGINDLYRRMVNLVRLGRVIDADYGAGKVRVQIGEDNDRRTVTKWLNWGSDRAGYDRTSRTLEIGEQVVLLSPSGRLESAVIVCSLRQALHPHPSTDPNDVLSLFRVLEGTDYWVAMERRLFNGDVNPQEKKQNALVPLGTVPPQQKVLSSDKEVAEALAYVYQSHIRPELLAVMEYVAMTTQPDAEVFVKLVANCISSGNAVTLVEAGVRGDGDATLTNRAISGGSSFETETNPNKTADSARSSGNAVTNNETQVVAGSGDATETTTVETVQGNATQVASVKAAGGKAVKTITIDGDESELIINLKNTAHVKINIGDNQSIEADGKRVTIISDETLIKGKFVKIEADVLVDGDVTVSGEVTDSVRAMSKDRDIYNAHEHAVVKHAKAIPTDKQK